MKYNYFLFFFVFLNIMFFFKNVYGDEMWMIEEYKVIYFEDRKNIAVWRYGDNVGYVFIDGLGGKIEG